MTRTLTPLVCLALGLFVYDRDYNQSAWTNRTTAIFSQALERAKAKGAARAKASAAPPAARPAAVSEADVRRYLTEAGINKAAEIYRQAELEFRFKSMGGVFREVAKFPNFPEHEKWLRGVVERLAEKSGQWRGVGSLILGGQAADIEIHLTRSGSCLDVEAYMRLNGVFTPLAGGPQCAEQMLYKDGDYFLSWAVYEQFLTDVDLSLLTVSLPQSKNESLRYLIDGEDQWQNATFTWVPVSQADRLARTSEISNEILKGGK